jgi:formate transporter
MSELQKTDFDAILPHEMAAKAEAVGIKKARMPVITTLVLAVLAGAFIALGAVFSTTVSAGALGVLPHGIGRLFAGIVFSLGLILVIVAGAELFTGNNLIVMAWANRKVKTPELLRNWSLVYVGNFVGALGTAVLVFLGEQFGFARGAVGAAALSTAEAKMSFNFVQAIALGVLCNALVCLAVWLTYSCRTTTDKILAVVAPIAAFVAAGFEHSVANMYFIPMALLIRSFAPDGFWSAIGQTADAYPMLTWQRFLIHNLLPVTLGNVLGGAGLVGLVYWFVYLRAEPKRAGIGVTDPPE